MHSFDSIQRHVPISELTSLPNTTLRLGEHVMKALNKIKKPSTVEEITELLNGDLAAGDRPFQTREIAAWLRRSNEKVVPLYWLDTRPRK